MDKTIQQYLDRIYEINNDCRSMNFVKMSKIPEVLCELSVMKQYMDDVISKIAKVKLELESHHLSLSLVEDIKYDNLEIPKDMFPTNNIIEVDEANIPEAPLYWIRSTKQYAVNIGGIVFRGNIGDMYNTSNNPDIYYCKWGMSCKKVMNNKYCKYYHDPLDLYKLYKYGKISHEQFAAHNRPRNFVGRGISRRNMAESLFEIKNLKCLFNYQNNTGIGGAHCIKKNKYIDTMRDLNDRCMHDILLLILLNK